MSAPDLQTKLLNSEAATSLTAEQRIAVTLQRLNWRVVHSWYFTDQKTGKLRETDVLGRQLWERNLKSGRETADVNLLIETKSAKGFHLIFSPIENINSFGIVNTEWLGQEGKNRERIAETLNGSGLTDEQIATIMNRLERMSYPGEWMLLRRFRIDPPPTEVNASAFRETNIGGEKDLDSSVLWRASQSLSSAVQSLKVRFIEFCLDELPIRLNLALKRKLDPVTEALESLHYYIRLMDIYHPVVVIDAPLWTLDEGRLQGIQWCRFHQVAFNGYSDWWFDVVHSSHFDQYAQDVTQHYQKEFRKAGAKLYEWSH